MNGLWIWLALGVFLAAFMWATSPDAGPKEYRHVEVYRH